MSEATWDGTHQIILNGAMKRPLLWLFCRDNTIAMRHLMSHSGDADIVPIHRTMIGDEYYQTFLELHGFKKRIRAILLSGHPVFVRRMADMSRLKKRVHDACHFATNFHTRFSRPVPCYCSALNIHLFPRLFSGRRVYFFLFLYLCRRRVHLAALYLLVPFHLYLPQVSPPSFV